MKFWIEFLSSQVNLQVWFVLVMAVLMVGALIGWFSALRYWKHALKRWEFFMDRYFIVMKSQGIATEIRERELKLLRDESNRKTP